MRQKNLDKGLKTQEVEPNFNQKQIGRNIPNMNNRIQQNVPQPQQTIQRQNQQNVPQSNNRNNVIQTEPTTNTPTQNIQNDLKNNLDNLNQTNSNKLNKKINSKNDVEQY